MKVIAIVALSTSFMLIGCNSVRVKSWVNPDFEKRPIGKTAVLGVTNSDSINREYEDLFVSTFNEMGVAAASLHAEIDHTNKLTEDELAELLAQHGFNSLLITRPISETPRQETVSAPRPVIYVDDYVEYYDYAWGAANSPSYIKSYTEFELESSIYNVATRKLVWSGRKKVNDTSSDRSNMKSIINGILNDLEKNSMIEKRP